MIKKFTKEQANLFTFFRFPYELLDNLRYENVSIPAMVLYGLLLDRNSLSQQNDWFDEEGYIYIYYSREEVGKRLRLGENTVTKLFLELRNVDLIEEVRQGLGKPNRIYVGQFLTQPIDNSKNYKKSGYETSKSKVQNLKKYGSESVKNEDQEPQKMRPNHTYRNYTEKERLTHTHTDTEEPAKIEVKTEEKIVCVANLLTKKEENTQTPKTEGVENLQGQKSFESKATTCDKTTYGSSGSGKPTDNTRIEEKIVCVADSLTLQKEIKRITGCQVPVKKVGELLTISSLERIKYHLANWHIHKQHQKSEGAGWFFTVVEHDIEPEKMKIGFTGEKRKVPQRDNFGQREYTREYLESFYDNLTFDANSASGGQEPRSYTYINE